jgi:hypothetical protein
MSGFALLISRVDGGSQEALKRGKRVSSSIRLGFAAWFPCREGDNCLLTTNFGFVDLAFSRLLALRCGAAATPDTAANRGESPGQTPGGDLSLFAHGL